MPRLNTMLLLLLGIAAYAHLLSSCARLPAESTGYKHTVFNVPTGPEDFVLDTSDFPRLIVSCGIKRKGDASKGEFVSIYLNSHYIEKMKVFMPDSIELFPHGINLLKQNDSLILLVVNHEKNYGKKGRNSILRFLVRHNRLHFIQSIYSDAIINPNAVCGLPDGSFFFSNMNRGAQLSKGNAGYCKNGKCEIVTDKIFYANGVAFHDNSLFVASTLENKIYRYPFANNKLNVEGKQVFANLKGGDNLKIVNGVLYCAAHFDVWAFLKHYKNYKKHSPSAVWSKSLVDGKEELIYFNKGSVIDASATAIVYKDKIYITGVFDPEVVVLHK